MKNMILGIGHDIVQISRIADIYTKYDKKFLNKILHPLEQEIAIKCSYEKLIRYLAKRYAAKEAITKALGTGFRNGIKFHNMAILNEGSGKPYVELYGAAKNIIESKTKGKNYIMHISLSDDEPLASAYVVIELY